MKKSILTLCFQMGLVLMLHAQAFPPANRNAETQHDRLTIRSITPESPLPAGQLLELKFALDVTLASADTASVHLILINPATKRGQPHMIRDIPRGSQQVELSAKVIPVANSDPLNVLIGVYPKDKTTGFYGSPSVLHRSYIEVEQRPVEDIKTDKNEPMIAANPEPRTEQESFPVPEERILTVQDLQSRLIELNGKIVRVRINYAAYLTQISANGYRVWAGFHGAASGMESKYFFVPSEGKSFFESLQKKGLHGGSGELVYVHVRSDPPFRAGSYMYSAEVVGLRYRADEKVFKW